LTLTIDPGTYSPEFPERLADELGFRLVDHSSLERKVADYGWTEDGTVSSLLHCQSGMAGKWPLKLWQFARRLQESMLVEAGGGHVIYVGWAAAETFRRLDVGIRLRITGSIGLRAHRICRQLAYSTIEPAYIELDHADDAIDLYLASAFRTNLSRAGLFHHVCSADEVTEAECLDNVCSLLARASDEVVCAKAIARRIHDGLEVLHEEEAPHAHLKSSSSDQRLEHCRSGHSGRCGAPRDI
jgi:hypothetical protein